MSESTIPDAADLFAEVRAAMQRKLNEELERLQDKSADATPSDDHVIWRDPPPNRGVPGVWEPSLRALMDRPGQWGLIRETETVDKAYRHTANLRHARLIRMPEGFWEFTARLAEDGAGHVYGRYLGATPEDMAHFMGRRGVKRVSRVAPDRFPA